MKEGAMYAVPLEGNVMKEGTMLFQMREML
jgi:hypothetical protein